MSLPVTVITPTIPGREAMLAECTSSVSEQHPGFAHHLVGWDVTLEGPAAIRNRLAGEAKTPWLLFLDDDDLLHARYSAMLEMAFKAAPRASIIYTAWEVEGDIEPQPLLGFHPEMILQGRNHIPVTAAIRTKAFKRLGGFNPQAHVEDMDLWQRAIRAGLEFHYIPYVLWTYRRGPEGRNHAARGIRLATGCPTCGYRPRLNHLSCKEKH